MLELEKITDNINVYTVESKDSGDINLPKQIRYLQWQIEDLSIS